MNKTHLINVMTYLNETTYEEEKRRLESGEAELRELLDAYLLDEGIWGYTDEIMGIINIYNETWKAYEK